MIIYMFKIFSNIFKGFTSIMSNCHPCIHCINNIFIYRVSKYFLIITYTHTHYASILPL